MADSSVFDRLVGSLSTSERRDMLDRLRGREAVVEREAPEEHPFEAVDVELVLQRYGFLRRLLVLLRSIFTGRERHEIVADDLVSELGARIRSAHPGLIDVRKSVFLDGFYQEIVRLRDSARFFAQPLDRAWNRNRSQFVAFLLGLILPEVQGRLIAETDPVLVAADEPGIAEHQLKKKLLSNALQALELMPYDGRETLYANARFLDSLHQLSRFSFDEILGAFDRADQNGFKAPVFAIREPLTRLYTILRALSGSPSSNVLEALALFSHNDELDQGLPDVEAQLVRLVQNGAHHLQTIWACTATLPLSDLVRYLHQDVNFTVNPSTGGEDWFNLVKRFWQERAERAFSHYQYKLKKQQVLDEALEYTEGHKPLPIANYPVGPAGEGRHAASLGLLRAVLEGPFSRLMHQPMKTLLIEGEFYKAANREEYTIAFNGLLDAEQTIDSLRKRLAESGDLGRARHSIRKDTAPRAERLRRISALASQVDEIAGPCVKAALDHLRIAGDVIYGVLYGEIGGKYDTISNLGTIGGRSHTTLMKQLDDAMNRAIVCRDGLGKVYDIENSIARRLRSDSAG